MKRLIYAIFIVLTVLDTAHSQASQNQRTAVIDKSPIACGFSLSTACSSAQEDGIPYFRLDSCVGIGIVFATTISLEATLPFSAIMYSDLERNYKTLALGDPEIAVIGSFREGDWQFSAEASYAHPLGIWNKYQAERVKLQTGSGYKSIGLLFSAHRYMDPLVAGFSIGLEHCFDKIERNGIASLPVVAKIGLFASEALNGSTAISAAILQSLASRQVLSGSPVGDRIDYSISGSASIIFHAQSGSLSIGVSKSLSDISAPIVIRTEFSYSLKEGAH